LQPLPWWLEWDGWEDAAALPALKGGTAVLTCDCGARFEVDDALAGQEITCPECQQPLKAPGRGSAPPRTSGLALASVVLALVGAFTVVGTLAAVCFGLAALVRIRRHRDRLAGAGFAVFGVVAGLTFTALTLFALSRNELFGLGGWLREHTMAGQVDTTGPLTVDVPGGASITRPSEKWGRVARGQGDDPAVGHLQTDRDLLLLNVSRYAYVDVKADRNNNRLPIDTYCDLVMGDFRPRVAPGLDEDGPFGAFSEPEPQGPWQPSRSGDFDVRERAVKVRRGGQVWIFLIRVYRKTDDPGATTPIYVVRGYTQARSYARNEAELRRAMDSFRVPPGR
jgi:hypothetical protein